MIVFLQQVDVAQVEQCLDVIRRDARAGEEFFAGLLQVIPVTCFCGLDVKRNSIRAISFPIRYPLIR